jgi:lipid biosynthesis B12-binding/radical SAM protein
MKILLISSNYASTPYPVYPLGMGVVAQALRQAGHEVALADMFVAERSLDVCRQAIRRELPGAGVVGISIRNVDNVNQLNETEFISAVAELVAAVRQETDAPVVLGGSGYSLLPQVILEKTGADYGIAGEGERLMVELVAAIAAGQPPVRGTVLHSDRRLHDGDIGRAYYDPTLLRSYLKAGSIAAVQSKRGCSLRCGYCSYPQLEGGSLRPRPAGEVVDDIQQLVEQHKVPYIFFADSVFNDDAGHYLEVLREMQRRRLAPPWSAFLKPSGLTPEAVALMRATGLAAAELGSDAACDATLRGLRKPFNWQQVVAASNLLLDQGATVAHYFMFGGPGETPQTVLEGIDNIRRLRCSAAFVFMGIRILPQTDLHARAIREGIIPADCDLLKPVYYLSPAIDRNWLEAQLTQAFDSLTHVLFPPDKLDDKLQLLHRLGYAGSLWEMLAPTSTS